MSEFTDKQDEMAEMRGLLSLLMYAVNMVEAHNQVHRKWERHWRTRLSRFTGWKWIALPEPIVAKTAGTNAK